MNQIPPKPAWTAITWLCLFVLTACAPPPPLVSSLPPARMAEHPSAIHQSVADLASWTITGAIAAKQKNKAWSASLTWQQFSAKQYLIRLFGPLGGGTLLLEKKGALIIYRDGQKILKSTDAEHLFAQETGFHFPIDNLYYWVRGLAAPGVTHTTQYNPDGQLFTLIQAGYTLHYTAYKTVDNLVLPTKIQLENQEGTVKLVIKHWQIST